jgi:cellulose synthase/poly-beta-1,6-N-acetylglucosamine synthase-like glycosyltransferase
MPALIDRPTKAQLNLAARLAYAGCAETTGPLVAPGSTDQRVLLRRVASIPARLVLTLLVLANAATGVVFVGWLLLPSHVPGTIDPLVDDGGWAGWLTEDAAIAVARACFCVIVAVDLIRLVQNVAIWVFAFNAKDPVPIEPPTGLRVALLTTIVPAKEPIDVAARTLRRMKAIAYCGQVDVWILDEGDDDEVKAIAARLGVRHFSRKGRPEYNQPSGEFRARTKSGNHNAWRAEHEHEYDVVAQMDPDHVPLPGLLARTLGYFRDPDVAFVVAPQVYGNMHTNCVSHGASVQQYLFSGVVERGGNGLDAPLLIGTNHLYRPEAWRQIGGYQDSIIEDHLTSMRVHAAVNPATGRRWKGVYTPDVVAIGEGPTSWTDYFNQQKRWAYGIWEILINRSLRTPGLKLRQRLLYSLVQLYYPSLAVSLLLGNVATACYMFLGVGTMHVPSDTWLLLWGASIGSWFGLWCWLRRYNIAPHEREEIGMLGMALAMFAGPVYLSAAVTALFRRPLAYAVTAKGKLRTTDSVRTFRLHLVWALFGASMLWASVAFDRDVTALRVWCVLAVFAGITPPTIALYSWIRARGASAAAEAVEAADQSVTETIEFAAVSLPIPGPRVSVETVADVVSEPDSGSAEVSPAWWKPREPAAVESGTAS